MRIRSLVMGGAAIAALLIPAIGAAAAHEDETRMAKASKVTLQEAMKTAVAKVPGRVLWSARENFDGGTFVMVEVIPEDRSDIVVTIDAKTGLVVKVEPAKPRAAMTATGTGESARPAGKEVPALKGTITITGGRAVDYPYLARISMDDAVKAATRKAPGRLVEVYVYAEAGFLLYGIETSPGVGRMTLVKVDAGTGKILSLVRM